MEKASDPCKTNPIHRVHQTGREVTLPKEVQEEPPADGTTVEDEGGPN